MSRCSVNLAMMHAKAAVGIKQKEKTMLMIQLKYAVFKEKLFSFKDNNK